MSATQKPERIDTAGMISTGGKHMRVLLATTLMLRIVAPPLVQDVSLI